MHPMFKKEHHHWLLRIFLFAVYLVNGFFYIPRQSIVSDELDHSSYSFRFIKGHPQKIRPYDDGSTMPITALNTLPRIIEQTIHPGLKKNDNGASDIINGRYITLLLSIFIGVYILIWAKELYGEAAATFSLFLFVFCPNLNAQTGFVATDAYAALFTIISAYYFWKWQKNGGWKNLLFFSLALGLAQLTKQSLSILVVVFFLLFFFFWFKEKGAAAGIKRKAFQLFVSIFLVLFVINAGFLFCDSFMPLGAYQFKSHSFNNLQTSLSVIRNLPLPLPSPYLYGLDLVKRMTEMDPGDSRVSLGNYILGEKRNTGGFWYYYFIILLFKTPLVIIVGGIVLLWNFRPAGNKNFFTNEFIILVLIASFFIFFNFMVKRQVGIRHILIIYPLIYVLLGRLVLLAESKLQSKLIRGSVIIYSVCTFYFFFPNLIAYSNELVIDKKDAYKIFADSNLDWGQGKEYLKKFLKTNKSVEIPGPVPKAGKFIVSSNDYVGLNNDPDISWIRRFEPADEVHFSYLFFDITEQDLQKYNFK
jgi:hypothetical protein